MKKKYLFTNLSEYFDNAVFLPLPETDAVNIGINGLHLSEMISSFANKSYGGIPFQILKNKYGFDNMSCDGQEILKEGSHAEEICFLGFNEFGTVRDTFAIQYRKSEKTYDFVFKTFHTSHHQGLDTAFNNRCVMADRLLGSDGQKHFLYLWRQSLEKEENAQKLILPVNLSMHIIAITVLTD